MTKSHWDAIKKSLYAQCKELGIEIPENSTIRQFRTALDAYYRDAAVVNVEGKVCLRRTEKPTAEYNVEFTITGYYTIRAESEEAAREWVESRLDESYNIPGLGYSEIIEWELGDSYKLEN